MEKRSYFSLGKRQGNILSLIVKKDRILYQGYFYLSLGGSTTDKLEFCQRNTRKNLGDQQTTPVSDPERLLKPKGYLNLTTASTGKKYQPKVSQINTKVMIEESTPEKDFKQTPFDVDVVPEIKIEIEPCNTPNCLNK
jgi:hypothetical protein